MRLKIEGDKKHGYYLKKWTGLGNWKQLSHHDSRERAVEARERQECAALINKSWKKSNEADV